MTSANPSLLEQFRWHVQSCVQLQRSQRCDRGQFWRNQTTAAAGLHDVALKKDAVHVPHRATGSMLGGFARTARTKQGQLGATVIEVDVHFEYVLGLSYCL